ncbi:MAG: hypothetical protein JKY12_03565 [Sneathiella sp.]|nr:hypothetical protein [Sneathiella sp.]
MRIPKKLIRIIGVFITSLMCVVGPVASSPVFAGKADVFEVKVVKTEADIYRFSVTVSHADEGWDHYADRWDVLDAKRNVLGTRVLMHPHENEQPFTRSMTLSIPMHVKAVTIRARDKGHGYGGSEVRVVLPK